MPHTEFIGPNGETDWPSVTQVCDVPSKPQLYAFYAKHGLDGVAKILADTGDIGREFHGGIQARFEGKPEMYTTDAQAMVDAFFNDFVKPYKVVPITLETKVVSLKDRYHGTYDGVVHVTALPYGKGIKGIYTGKILADWKSSNGIYDTHGLQLGGYWGAESNPLLQTTHGLIVQVRRDTQVVRRKVFQNLEFYHKEFLHARALWDWMHSKGAWAK